MRILHTSDWHLGRTLHGVDLRDHQAAFIEHVVALVESAEVDAVLVSGDVYDRAIPPVESVTLLSSALARLSELATVIVTSGNHDSARRLGFGSQIMRESVHVRTAVASVGSPVQVTGRDGHIALVYPLPYLEPDEARVSLATETADDGSPVLLERSHEAVMAQATARVRADVAQRRAQEHPAFTTVAMAHAFVIGGEPSESERPIVVGGVDSVPAGVFSGIDYVALGHLHGPQQMAVPGDAGVARYSGSPLAYSFSERHHVKSSVLVDVGAGGVEDITLVPTPVPRRLSHIEDNLAEVLGAKYVDRRDDWVRVVLTDSTVPPRHLERVREVFPHALIVQRRPSGALWERATAPRVTAASDPVVVAAEFLEHVTGRAPSDAEVAILDETFEQLRRAEREH